MKKIILRLLIAILIICFIAGGFVIFKGHAMYKEALSTISLSDKVTKLKQDSNYIKLEDLPADYKNAVISVEDHRFYKHGAIDIIAIGRAILTNVQHGKLLEGGSTISQQVSKNLYFISTDNNAMYRKIAEIFMAHDLESNYKKDDILELYVNTIYFGDGYYGIEEACQGYLKKSAKDMDLYEATQMAGIPNAPSVYAPTANFNLTLSRQKKVISTMIENGYLSQEKANEILNKIAEVSQ